MRKAGTSRGRVGPSSARTIARPHRCLAERAEVGEQRALVCREHGHILALDVEAAQALAQALGKIGRCQMAAAAAGSRKPNEQRLSCRIERVRDLPAIDRQPGREATAQRGRVSTRSRRNSTLRNFHVPSIRT